jgi:hypothetical protein
MNFGLGTACRDEFGRWVLVGEAVSLRFYTELDEDDGGLYLEINTDLFAPFYWIRNERTEEMARENAPKLKQLIEDLMDLCPSLTGNGKNSPIFESIWIDWYDESIFVKMTNIIVI